MRREELTSRLGIQRRFLWPCGRRVLLRTWRHCGRNHHHRSRSGRIHPIGIFHWFLLQFSDCSLFYRLLCCGVFRRVSLLSVYDQSCSISQDNRTGFVVHRVRSDRILLLRLFLLRYNRIPEIGLILIIHTTRVHHLQHAPICAVSQVLPVELAFDLPSSSSPRKHPCSPPALLLRPSQTGATFHSPIIGRT